MSRYYEPDDTYGDGEIRSGDLETWEEVRLEVEGVGDESDCNTCLLQGYPECDKICKSKATLIQAMAHVNKRDDKLAYANHRFHEITDSLRLDLIRSEQRIAALENAAKSCATCLYHVSDLEPIPDYCNTNCRDETIRHKGWVFDEKLFAPKKTASVAENATVATEGGIEND